MGVVLYEMCTNQLPFNGVGETVNQKIEDLKIKIINSPAPHLMEPYNKFNDIYQKSENLIKKKEHESFLKIIGCFQKIQLIVLI